MNSKVRIAAVGVAIVAVLIGWLALRPSKGGAAGDAQASRSSSVLTVKAVRAQEETWPQVIEASGAIEAWQEIVVSPETGGLQLIELEVDVGDKVKRGQLLARLTDASLKVDLEKQEAVVAQAQATLAQATSDAKRAHVVEQSGALSAQKIEEYQISEATARASLASAKADLASIQLKLSQTRIVAPDDGIVTSKSGVLGSVISAGTEIFRLVRQGRLEWRPELDAQQLAAVHPGLPAQITLPGGKQIEGTVRTIGPALSTETGRASVYVSLPASSAARVGQFASGRLELPATPALTLPQSAIVMRDGRTYVYLLGDGDKVSSKLVKTGRRQNDRVELIDGLAADARVVESGGAFLNEGARVTVLASS